MRDEVRAFGPALATQHTESCDSAGRTATARGSVHPSAAEAVALGSATRGPAAMQAARVAPTATPDSTGDVSDIFKSTEDISDILSDAPASQPPPGDSGEGPRGPDGPAWDPDANHVSVADMVGTHPENHDGNIIRRPSEVRRQHQWRKGGKARQPKKASVSRRATAAVLQILPEHLTFKIDFKAMEAFRKHPDEENFGAALNNRASLATIETLAAVLSIACAIGDLEGTTEAEHLVFRSLDRKSVV